MDTNGVAARVTALRQAMGRERFAVTTRRAVEGGYVARAYSLDRASRDEEVSGDSELASLEALAARCNVECEQAGPQ